MNSNNEHPWGRVDETGAVYLRQADGSERVVGQFPDGSAEEALAYFERKYTDLAGQVTLLEQRAKRGAEAKDLVKSASLLSETIGTANAIGDLAALLKRLESLGGKLAELTEKQIAHRAEALSKATRERTELVEEVEKLASSVSEKSHWKNISTQLDTIFARWQKHQHDGPKLAAEDSTELWKRFREAKLSIETQRKVFFTQLEHTQREAREAKQDLVNKAENLLSQGSDGLSQYRKLLEEWKKTGRAGKRVDDALWQKFKTVGDQLYAARSETIAEDEKKFAENFTRKGELLDEAEKLLDEKDHKVAKEKLLSIQSRWELLGKVPRDQVKTVEDRLRKVEKAVRALEEDFWHKNNPETKARTQGLASQLSEAIEKLQKELDQAVASQDSAKVTELQEALEARKAWLSALDS